VKLSEFELKFAVKTVAGVAAVTVSDTVAVFDQS
jgi:hypothetical protein